MAHQVFIPLLKLIYYLFSYEIFIPSDLCTIFKCLQNL
jgi:hypothetical protein